MISSGRDVWLRTLTQTGQSRSGLGLYPTHSLFLIAHISFITCHLSSLFSRSSSYVPRPFPFAPPHASQLLAPSFQLSPFAPPFSSHLTFRISLLPCSNPLLPFSISMPSSPFPVSLQSFPDLHSVCFQCAIPCSTLYRLKASHNSPRSP